MSTQTTNPFTGQTTASTTTIPVPEFLREWGFRLQESMLEAARVVTDGGEGRAFLLAISIAILFGMVHIIGPGHGKLFTIGYFGSRRARLREGLILSAMVNILDSLSALLLVGVAYGILSVSLRTAGAEVGRITRLIAYAAVSVLALSHLIGHIREGGRHSHDHGGHQHKPVSSPKTMKPWMLAVSVGLIPCPVSFAILAWGIVNGVLGFAAVLVAGVSIGGMIAMTAFSLALIGGKQGMTALMERRGFSRALTVFEFASLGFLFAVGVLMFISAL